MTTILRRLRAQGDHWKLRLGRMEAMAQDGRVNWQVFPESRAYVEGLADAYQEALEIIDGGQVDGVEIDPCVIELARQGLPVEAIAARCGVTERQVAENLIRHVEAQLQEPKP
jgi:hypothetical protein